MTYRNKLLLKRFLIVFAILVVIVAIALLIGFTYLGRYVVYTEDGAHFSTQVQSSAADLASARPQISGTPQLVYGESIYETPSTFESDVKLMRSDEINGLYLDYGTLKDGSTLNSVEFSENGYNTLMLEMRVAGSEILSTPDVITLIDRAKNQDISLVAKISCLDDSDFALAHGNDALPIEGGALWVCSTGRYWLDPTSDVVQDYLCSMILELVDMGFDEVVLDNFEFPLSTGIYYPSDRTRDDMLVDAYQAIEETIGIRCTLGIYVSDPETGHQAFDCAEHLYIAYENGGSVQTYAENHQDYYMVFLTSSHDTRFNDYGKIYIS